MKKTSFLSALVLLTAFAAQPGLSADSFYTRLLDRGVRDLERGLTDEALTKLRTACFGFLDEPALLAEGLMQLGRAQARAGDSAALVETIDRLIEIEDRFKAYSSFDGNPKAQFEASLKATLPEQVLARTPMLTHLVPATELTESEVTQPTPRQRRKVLESRLAADPLDAEALLELGRLHFVSGKPKRAGETLDRLLALEPKHPEALCLRARIGSEAGECAPVLAGFQTCADLTATDQTAALVIECLTSAGRSDEARELLETLPPETRSQRRIARFERRLAASKPDSEDPSDASVSGEPAEPSDAAVSGGSNSNLSGDPKDVSTAVPNPAPEITLGLTLEERIRRIRQEIADSRYREQLDDAFEHARALADRYPDSSDAQHLVAEVAYLSSQWQAVLDYSVRGGSPPPTRPELLFYQAVAHFELGQLREADSILRQALPTLPRNSFVDRYVDLIFIPESP